MRLTGDRLGWKRRERLGVLAGLEGTLEEVVGGVDTAAFALLFLSLLADFRSSSKKKTKKNLKVMLRHDSSYHKFHLLFFFIKMLLSIKVF